jgi:probable F420-dependent oxidoreductase
VKLGVCIFLTDYAIDAASLGRAVEERGFESLFLTEHTHIPSSRLTPFPGGGELPRQYAHSLDPFVALGAVAAVTTKLRLGTGICLVIQRDPITLAKEVASLDHLSGGRVDLGIGGGWNREEIENHGTPFERRWTILRERVEAMKTIWTEEEATYQGEFVRFDGIWSWPKPVQRPHPPVLVGGNGPRTLERVVRYGQGWMPLAMRRSELAERMRELEELAAKAGRDAPPVSLFGVPPDPGRLQDYRDAGVSRCLFPVSPAPADEVLPVLDKLAGFVGEFG